MPPKKAVTSSKKSAIPPHNAYALQLEKEVPIDPETMVLYEERKANANDPDKVTTRFRLGGMGMGEHSDKKLSVFIKAAEAAVYKEAGVSCEVIDSQAVAKPKAPRKKKDDEPVEKAAKPRKAATKKSQKTDEPVEKAVKPRKAAAKKTVVKDADSDSEEEPSPQKAPKASRAKKAVASSSSSKKPVKAVATEDEDSDVSLDLSD